MPCAENSASVCVTVKRRSERRRKGLVSVTPNISLQFFPTTTSTAHIENTDDCTTIAELLCTPSKTRLSIIRRSSLRFSVLVHPDRGGNVEPTRSKKCMQIIYHCFEQSKNEASNIAWKNSETDTLEFVFKKYIYSCLSTIDREKRYEEDMHQRE